jgi:hypothetical protein
MTRQSHHMTTSYSCYTTAISHLYLPSRASMHAITSIIAIFLPHKSQPPSMLVPAVYFQGHALTRGLPVEHGGLEYGLSLS